MFFCFSVQIIYIRTASKWSKDGKKWIVFFQDTNGLVFRSVPAALGVSVKNNFALNSLTVPRKPGEPVGGICKLVNEEKKTSLTINVEYNQLDPLLRATISPEGDVADSENGFSPYPGNINVLIFHCTTYNEILQQSGGNIPEFVNPKYADEEKTTLQKRRKKKEGKETEETRRAEERRAMEWSRKTWKGNERKTKTTTEGETREKKRRDTK